MRSILMSIKPKYCELIANGKKTLEIRKTKPKLETPFKCYIYCTKDKNKIFWHNKIYRYIDDRSHNLFDKPLNGKVIGEFVCDDIQTFNVFENGAVQHWNYYNLEQACLTYNEIAEYIGTNEYGYAWHISDLIIYVEPNEIYEFYSACKNEAENDCSKCIDDRKQSCFGLIRPPQSWCYVKEAQE